jgi:hypothetical protein
MTTPLELATSAEALASKATEGPWMTELFTVIAISGRTVADMRRPLTLDDLRQGLADADFIRDSRTLMPQLAAALREACERIATLEAECQRVATVSEERREEWRKAEQQRDTANERIAELEGLLRTWMVLTQGDALGGPEEYLWDVRNHTIGALYAPPVPAEPAPSQSGATVLFDATLCDTCAHDRTGGCGGTRTSATAGRLSPPCLPTQRRHARRVATEAPCTARRRCSSFLVGKSVRAGYRGWPPPLRPSTPTRRPSVSQPGRLVLHSVCSVSHDSAAP